MIKKFNEFINESFEVTPDDYSYFKRQIVDRYYGSKQELINDLIENRNEWIRSLLMTARSHWELGGGTIKDFPEKEYFKVINEVIDEVINERGTNEGIRDTFNKVRSKLKEYTDVETGVEEPELKTFDREIELDTEFENRIPEEEYFELERNSTFVKYSKDELNKLSLYFGVANPNEYDLGKYFFSVKNKIFGQPMKTFKGTIDKKKIAETKEIVYLINMYIEVKTRESRGSEWVVIKYDELEDVFKFLDTIIEK